MHDTETRNRFIERRAQGWSLKRIAEELHVAKRTLVDWNREAQREIAELQKLELEALHERILVSHEDELRRLTAHLNRMEAILARRNLDCLSTESLFFMSATVRAQLRRLAGSVGDLPGATLEAAAASTSATTPALPLVNGGTE